MQIIDRSKFFAGYRAAFGPLKQQQVDGLNHLLTSLEADKHISDVRHAAYMLATIKRETGDTYQPIREIGKGKGRPYGRVDPETKQVYYGRGYTQNTWRTNYAMLTEAWNQAHPERRLDFVHSPDLLLTAEYSYFAMSYAMRHGSYTGVGLSRYIHDAGCDYYNARKIINGLDCAQLIAGFAGQFETILRSAIKQA